MGNGEASSGSADVPDLIPARMLNEFAYCPRLAFLEWVDGEFTDNLETIEGRFVHRRVDQPSRGKVPLPTASASTDHSAAPNGSPPESGTAEQAADREATGTEELPVLHARSLLLSAPGEGLIARLDLLELEGQVATPVDYKRSRAPDLPEGAWEPERVQLCAQGLILRENGFQCDEGELYFAGSRRRVTIPFDEPLVARTRELIAGMRQTFAAGHTPPPLVDSPKCPRCSLVGICLPDETTLLQSRATASITQPAEASPGTPADDGTREIRRLLPARDDALPLYLSEQGTSLGKSGDRLVIRRRREVLREVRLIDVSQVCLFGNVQVTAQALRELTIRGVPVCHFTYGGWFHGMTAGLVHKNVELRRTQFATAASPAASLVFARAFIVGKIRNSRTLLRRHLPERKADLNQLDDLRRRAERCPEAASLLGIEGTAARVYFGGFFHLLSDRSEFDVNGRNRRPPRDPVNALLSFVYGLLVKELTVVLQSVGFDPMLGFFHQPRYGRPSLALDLTEEFRPLIGDSVVLTVINNGEVDRDSFIERAGMVALTTAGRRSVLAAFERRLNNEVTHPLFGYRISYRRVLEVQARLLSRVLTGELPEYPNFCTR
ncbi:MAG: CRISPR-associated endonuclease Cas1 [Planctomycetaceae bacterium]|nr:CRISPR-associated endonuclease Cas1 [Planctomycetaceae bacterium]